MSVSVLIRRLARLLALVVLGFASYYLVVYLLRWEWNRAIIAGVFVIIAELALIADLLLARIGRVADRIAVLEKDEQARVIAAHLLRTRPAPGHPFAWLSADRDRSYVLVPILLGAGVILSAVAFVVERLSRVTAAPVAEHQLARGLATMALPQFGLSPTGQPPSSDLDEPRTVDTSERRNAGVIISMIVVLTGIILGLAFGLITQSEPTRADSATQIDLIVDRRNLAQPDVSVAEALWGMCRVVVTEDVGLVSVTVLQADDPGELRMTIAPSPATFDEREFLGCLRDAHLDRVIVDVVNVARVPWPPAEQ